MITIAISFNHKASASRHGLHLRHLSRLDLGTFVTNVKTRKQIRQSGARPPAAPTKPSGRGLPIACWTRSQGSAKQDDGYSDDNSTRGQGEQ